METSTLSTSQREDSPDILALGGLDAGAGHREGGVDTNTAEATATGLRREKYGVAASEDEGFSSIIPSRQEYHLALQVCS